MTVSAPQRPVRRIHCVLSPRSLPYARLAFRSLFAHCLEPFDLTLITDDESDKATIAEALDEIDLHDGQHWRVWSKRDADERAASFYAGFPLIRAFREGHPCWRKITDPPLFAGAGEEMIVLDPDLYFPNRFTFEPTPQTGLALMWQRPSCLLPHEVVMAAYQASVPLAHHVDIGVAQWRNRLDLAWLERLIAALGGTRMPRKMHVEAIVWAALAMRMGGGYLDPRRWSCWRNAQWKRVAGKIGVAGATILAAEDFASMKCFHAGGVAKWWVPARAAAGGFAAPRTLGERSALQPFVPLAQGLYESTRRRKDFARRLGYYRLFPAQA
jgi:hypothetical protein